MFEVFLPCQPGKLTSLGRGFLPRFFATGRTIRPCSCSPRVLKLLRQEAEPLLREALQGLDEVQGKQHPDTPLGRSLIEMWLI